MRATAKFTVTFTVCCKWKTRTHGIFDCEFGFHSHEWSCSKMSNSSLCECFCVLVATRSPMQAARVRTSSRRSFGGIKCVRFRDALAGKFTCRCVGDEKSVFLDAPLPLSSRSLNGFPHPRGIRTHMHTLTDIRMHTHTHTHTHTNTCVNTHGHTRAQTDQASSSSAAPPSPPAHRTYYKCSSAYLTDCTER